MTISKVGQVVGPPSPNIHLGSAAGPLASVCLTASDRSLDLTGQTRQVLARIEQHLTELGSSRQQVLMAQVWLAHIDEYDRFVPAWNAWVDAEQPPALSVVQAAAARRDSLVEIRVYAARSSSSQLNG